MHALGILSKFKIIHHSCYCHCLVLGFFGRALRLSVSRAKSRVDMGNGCYFDSALEAHTHEFLGSNEWRREPVPGGTFGRETLGALISCRANIVNKTFSILYLTARRSFEFSEIFKLLPFDEFLVFLNTGRLRWEGRVFQSVRKWSWLRTWGKVWSIKF